MNCYFCKNLANTPHHLSYQPEIIINICKKCHFLWHIKFAFPLYRGDRINYYVKLFKEYTRVARKAKNKIFTEWKKEQKITGEKYRPLKYLQRMENKKMNS